MKQIQPVTPVRTKEGYGYWTHPDYFEPANGNEYGAPGEFEAWLKAHSLEVYTLGLESDLNADAVQSAYEAGDGDVSDWEPTPPAGEGWFIGSIHDTEDGPHVVWLRRELKPAVLSSEALAAENVALKDVVGLTVNNLYASGYEAKQNSMHPWESLIYEGEKAMSTPATDAAITEIKAQGVALAINHLKQKFTNLGVPITNLEWLEVELRAGRKG